ncbi:MAG TPA: GNAT family N-acetyltransferase [Mucilaginibacter sp.]|jgi:GNAT superfamily N-acetyltransferase|nr:GNAT family N-acetyltransferase [Mucilaginibacter sp.]
MDIVYRAAQTDADFEQILSLQRTNHYTAISQEILDREGFVYAEHTLEQLKTMAEHSPQIIALAGEKVVGYTLSMTSAMKDHISSLTPMFEQFDECIYKGKPLHDHPFVVGGQVCVAEGFRGMGVFAGLYHALAEQVNDKYRICVTEIARRNPRSLRAHQKMGFEVIRIYSVQGETWDIVAWDITQR